MKQIFCSILFLIISTTAVYANCVYDGKTYPTGTKIGGLVCQPDGSWRPAQ